MAESTIWWVLTGVAVAAELLSGTFYLLMLALGMAGGALAAHFGASLSTQLVIASVVAGGAVILWHTRKTQRHQEAPAQANANVNMDIGSSVHINAWNADGTADVQYRGARWTAIHRNGITPSVGTHRVAEIIGNRLLVDKA